jgi:hypothetical protein
MTSRGTGRAEKSRTVRRSGIVSANASARLAASGAGTSKRGTGTTGYCREVLM